MGAESGPEQAAASQAIEIMQALDVVPAPSFHVKADLKGGKKSWVVLKFRGSLVNRDARVLERVLHSLNRKPIGIAILDLTRVTRIDAAPLAALLLFARKRESMPYALACALVLSGSAVFDKIKVLGLAPLFEVFGSLQEAEYSLGLTAGRKSGLSRGKRNVSARVKLTTSTPRTAIVTLKGYLQESEAEYLSWLLRQAGRRGARHIIIDVSGISYANSPALGVLVNTARIWQEAYGEVCVGLAGVNTSLICTFKLLGIGNFFVIANTVEKVRDALRANLSSEATHAANTPSQPKQRTHAS